MKELKPKATDPTPATFIAGLATRGIALQSDGYKVWALPKSSMTVEDHAYATAHNDELVALTAKPGVAPRVEE